VPSPFDGRWPQVSDAGVGRAAYAEIVGTGGYPAVLDRTDARRARFFESCVDTIVRRDLSTGARAHDRANVRRLLSAIASTSASVLNFEPRSRSRVDREDVALARDAARPPVVPSPRR